MFVKLVRDNRVQSVYQCSHVSAKRFPPLGSPARMATHQETGTVPFSPDQIGIEIELCGVPNMADLAIRIPRDGDSVYISNDGGTTIHAYHVDADGNEIKGWQARQAAAAS